LRIEKTLRQRRDGDRQSAFLLCRGENFLVLAVQHIVCAHDRVKPDSCGMSERRALAADADRANASFPF